MRRGFTLIEILVVVAIIALLAAILLPSLASVRENGRLAVCLANERQMFTACRMYADAYHGVGPAIGEPYLQTPNWALQVQSYFTTHHATGTNLYNTRSILVCPTICVVYGLDMVRTYAMNATGHAGSSADPGGGWPADPDNYDDPRYDPNPTIPPRLNNYAHLHMDRVQRPSGAVLLVDSARASPTSGSAPPSTRTASPLDFRKDDHVQNRLGRFHSNRKLFNAAMMDGSARFVRDVPTIWKNPLP